ncbi:MAG: acyltransferase family protein [Chitinophagaceae bacterium]|nr:acyltransferase family protein [Oligoflexus sp.]
MDEEFAIKFLPLVGALRAYHSHEVYGMDSIPSHGPAIIATNHSLATYDIMLLMAAVYLHSGRMPRSLIDRAFYVVPGLGELMERLGCTIGNPDNAHALLENGELLYLAPGGMRESLRPSTERYQVRWNRRKGFARLAIETQTPVILAACPHADDIFKVYDNALTKWIYQQFRMPFIVARGVGPTMIPRPVKLEHFLSKPFYPPKMSEDPAVVKRQVYNFHKKLTQKMTEMIAQSVVTYKGPL